MGKPLTERLQLSHYDGASRVVEVVYVPRRHWRGADSRFGQLKAYDVTADGQPVGYVEQTIESTDRQAGRIRIPGRGRVAWAWRRADGKTNGAGVYEVTRRSAVANLLGFTSGKKAD